MAGNTGRSMGHTMSTALGTALGIGVSKAASTASKMLSDAFSSGFNRLVTLEKAEIQFKNMGLSAQQTKQQIQDLNQIVSGTSTSLSDAAGAAAMLAGAGVKAGEDLNQAVKALTNISAASGASAQDIGLVMMQIKASGKLMGSEALQLAQRGIPIYDMIGKSIGKTAAEVRKMGEDGKISFEQVVEAVNKGTGQLAKEMGETLPAKMANFRTALGRLTAAGIEPWFNDSKVGVTALTDAVDKATPKIKQLSEAMHSKVFDEWVPKLKEAWAAFQETGVLDQTRDALIGLFEAAKNVGVAMGPIIQSFAQASAVVGVGTWQIFVSLMNSAATIMQGLAPVLDGIGNLMKEHQGLVTAMVAAWVGFKTVPALIGAVGAALAPLAARFAATTTAMRGFSGQMAVQQRLAQMNGVQIGRMGAAVATLGTHVPVVGRMQQAFINTSTSVSHFGRTAGMAAAAGTGLKAAGSAIAGVFGGPVGLALAGTAGAVFAITSEMGEASNQARNFEKATKDLTTAQKALRSALIDSGGDMTAEVWQRATEMIDAYQAKLKATVDQHQTLYEGTMTAIGEGFKSAFSGDGYFKGVKEAADQSLELNIAAQNAAAAQRAIDKLGLSSEDLAKKVGGSKREYGALRRELFAMGQDGREAVKGIDEMRRGIEQSRGIASNITPGISELSDAIDIMGEKGSSASSKLDALKAAMDALNPARNKTEAIAQYGEALRRISEINVDPSAFNADGSLNAMTEAGANLSRTLADLAMKAGQVASTGGDMNLVAEQNEQAFARLAAATGRPIEEIRALYNELGGKTVDMTVKLSGASDTVQSLAKVKTAFDAQPNEKSIELNVDDLGGNATAKLEALGMKVETLPDGKTVRVTAESDEAKRKLEVLVATVTQLPPNKPISVDAPGGENVLTLLQAMGIEVRANNNKEIEVTSPLAPAVIEQLKAMGIEVQTNNDKTILVRANDTDYQNKKIDWTKPEWKDIYVRASAAGTSITDPRLGVAAGPPVGADGFIRAYAAGGIRDLERYANGGRLTDAKILPPRGNGALFTTPAGPAIAAENETQGEAFIPFAKGKRPRSLSILATVARLFGFELIPSGELSGSVSGLFGSIAAGITKQATKRVDGIAKFADGGIRVTAEELRRLAEGHYGAGSLRGAPYVFGGTAWGDCSGAMSAFARFAAGLDPWGGRFSTATEGDYIQKLGGKLGRGPAGTLRFGWYNGGPGGGHTAGTLPDGTNVEMGGANGGGMIGGNVGADDPQFTDHAYMEVAGGSGGGNYSSDSDDSLGNGSDLPDSGLSGYSFDPITRRNAGGSGDTSISGRLGGVVGAFVTGQIADFFDVLGMNDNPAWLQALVEYEQMHREDARENYEAEKKKLDADYKEAEAQRQADFEDAKERIEADYQSKIISPAERDRRLLELRRQYDADTIEGRHRYERAVVDKARQYGQVDDESIESLNLKQKYESDRLKADERLEQDLFDRESQYNRDKMSLDNLKASGTIDEETYRNRLNELRSKYDADVQGLKARNRESQQEMKRNYDTAQARFSPSNRYLPQTEQYSRFRPTDPGTIKPRQEEDLGTGKTRSTEPNSVKAAVQQAMSDRGWNEGSQWDAVDFIVTKESNWNPTATNPESGAFGLFQFLGDTLRQYLPDKNPDPGVQGQAGKRYIGDRYGDPLAARAWWEEHNWYDQGGIANGIGVLKKNTLRPERVLSPDQTEAFEKAMQNGFGGGEAKEIIGRLDQLITVMAKRGGGVTINNPTYKSESEAVKRQKEYASWQMMRMGGR
ncbi:tape measure protein [Gordonia paraffinivorans]|uniref:aggregation-promoting factor C-terminal-like domain-containing protein n=1 Tax=Gordonia paraffinivorans TaxID=175628 RepID=UPI003FCE67F2